MNHGSTQWRCTTSCRTSLQEREGAACHSGKRLMGAAIVIRTIVALATLLWLTLAAAWIGSQEQPAMPVAAEAVTTSVMFRGNAVRTGAQPSSGTIHPLASSTEPSIKTPVATPEGTTTVEVTLAPASPTTARCVSSGPPGGSYMVNLCIAVSGNRAQLGGDQTVEGSI